MSRAAQGQGRSRVAMVSLHTSPLEQPGTGDAGGLNVYVVETATRLARRGVEVDLFTRATQRQQPASAQLAPGVLVHHLAAGPQQPVDKGGLPHLLPEFAQELVEHLRGGDYAVVHTHYWLSGAAALHALDQLQPVADPPDDATDRELPTRPGQTARGVPALVHTMHTMARVKNLTLAPGERPEPALREEGEARVVAAAAALVANTPVEAGQLIDLYDARPEAVHVVPPGVDLEIFTPGPQQRARAAVGLPADAVVILFVGRIQPLKAPDVLVRAAAALLRDNPSLQDRLVVAILGGLSGSGLARPDALASLAAQEGLSQVVRFGPRVSRAELADWYRAADLVAVPSHSESFGLVAVEALACGTPVVAAKVGGLPYAVGEVGVLVDGHDPQVWAEALAGALERLSDPAERAAWSGRCAAHARRFGWERTVDDLEQVYAQAAAASATHRVTAGEVTS